MRLQHLDLARFGMFTDHAIELPSGKPDIHIIVGPNEAGKSTLRSAISDLLFGIESRSAFNFLHDYNEMRLGAVLTHGNGKVQFSRLKRNKQALRDADDNALPEELLLPFLGTADRAFFERMFGLDHATLVDGGLAILDAKDDVARTLFEASSGLGSLGEYRDRLEGEAKELWGTRRSKNRAYDKAFDAYQEAKAAMKEATSRVSVWKSFTQQAEDAKIELARAAEHLSELEHERARLERVRRVAPHLRKRQEQLSKKEALGSIVQLPEGAAEDVALAQDGIASAERLIAKHHTLAETAREKRDSITVDQTLLDHKRDIGDLEAIRHRVKDFKADIIKREAQVQTLLRSVSGIVADLGWDTADEAALAARIPSQLVRAEITQLLQGFGRLEEAASSTANAVVDKEGEIAARQEEVEALSPTGAPPALAARLNSARGLGNIRERKSELTTQNRAATDWLAEAINQLHPWEGDVAALQSMVVPGEDHVRNLQQQLSDLDQKQARLKEQLTEIEDNLELQQLEEQQLQRAKNPVAWESLVTSRENRDDLWSRIRSRDESIDDAGDEYERKVHDSDDLSDRRYSATAAVEQLELIRNAIETLRLNLQTRENRLKSVNEERDELLSDWAALVAALSLDEMPMAQFLTWRNRRDKTLDASKALAGADTRLQAFVKNEMKERNALAEALLNSGTTKPVVEGIDLSGLIEIAQHVTSEADNAKTTRAQLERQQVQDEMALGSLKKESAAASAAMVEWGDRWNARLAAASLAEDVGLGGAEAALGLFTKLAGHLKEIRELRLSRIATMQRDLDNFTSIATKLAEDLAPDLAGESAERTSATMSERLRVAIAAWASHVEAAKDLDENREKLEDAEIQLQDAHRTLQPLLELAGLTTVAGLPLAIERSDKLRTIESSIVSATDDALAGGDVLSLEALEGEVAEQDLTAITPRLVELQGLREQATEVRESRLLEKQAAERALDEIHGQDDAASAAARSEEALADMAAAVKRYLKVFVGGRLLKWSIDRYREEKQGPLLLRASELFAKLTLGSFDRLSVDFESTPPRLLGRRPDEKHTAVDGMSDGTRDQLYMALRLAALEAHLDTGQALPFVADDLFINYDDGRAEAGFEVLAELAERTQVIFLTHHDHLLPVARKAIGADLNVVVL